MIMKSGVKGVVATSPLLHTLRQQLNDLQYILMMIICILYFIRLAITNQFLKFPKLLFQEQRWNEDCKLFIFINKTKYACSLCALFVFNFLYNFKSPKAKGFRRVVFMFFRGRHRLFHDGILTFYRKRMSKKNMVTKAFPVFLSFCTISKEIFKIDDFLFYVFLSLSRHIHYTYYNLYTKNPPCMISVYLDCVEL